MSCHPHPVLAAYHGLTPGPLGLPLMLPRTVPPEERAILITSLADTPATALPLEPSSLQPNQDVKCKTTGGGRSNCLSDFFFFQL